jgi:hypothetical protein
MRIVSYHSRFTPSDTSSFPETISLPGLMNISFFMGTQIEILLTFLPYHRYDKLQMVFHLRNIIFLKSYDGRNNDFSILLTLLVRL